jgi:3-hydroxyisobutyrate dehydrogenase
LTALPATAVIGLGQMGRGIARRIAAAGALAGVCDAMPAAVAEAGLSPDIPTGTVADMAARADVLLFAVPTTADIRAGMAGVALNPRQIVVDLTTSDPAESRSLAAALSPAGYLDAAMTGGAAGADAGTLTLMVGGADDVQTRARPVLDLIATTVITLGPAGAGHAMKLVHNLILHTIFLANCEGLRLAERAGIDPAAAVAVLNAGNARSFVSEVRFPRDILSGTMQARSRVANLAKDLGLAVDWAARLEAPAPFGRLTESILAQAVAQGMAAADFALLYLAYGDLVAGLERAQ